jgi:nicotinamidase/pyrazinamidase
MVRYDAATALIVVDVQNDFSLPRGTLYVRGAEGILPLIHEQLGAARRDGAAVYFTRDWHPARTPHFQAFGGPWPVHCVQGTWGAEFVTGLEPPPGEVIQKGAGDLDGYSGFSAREPSTGVSQPTGLGQRLAERGIRRLVIAGLATDYCVRETAIDGARLGFEVEVVKAAVRAVEVKKGDASRAFQAMRRHGVILS